MTETLKATILKSQSAELEKGLYRGNDKFVAKSVMIDCRTREHVIEIDFFKCRNYRCDAVIRVKDKNIHLVGVARGGTKAEALTTVLERIGIEFNIERHHICRDHHYSTPIHFVTNAIADALEIPPEQRTTVLVEAEKIHAW